MTSTGKTETVAGYTCQHWLIGDKQDTDICMEVTSVERKSMDESLFTVPADYKKMEIPGMPTGKR